MRSQFSGYFDPSEDDLKALWQNGTIALDTNVLLGLYRMPEASRKEVFDLLTKIRERLWVPYHVLVEFHRNRLDAMRNEYDSTKKIATEARAAYEAFKSAVSKKGNRQRACWSQMSEKLSELNVKADELFAVAQTESDHYVSPNKPDSVLAFVEDLLIGRIGERPQSQAIVSDAEEVAQARYAVKMGPGYLDHAKAGDRYMFDGLVYDRQYGDYMVWRELLAHSAGRRATRIMFITSDVKEDWWLDSQSISGKRPQPELAMEMRREAGVDCFWMYTFSDFIESAKKHLHAHITEKAITDARQAEFFPHRGISLSVGVGGREDRLISTQDIDTVLGHYASRYMSAGKRVGTGFATEEGRTVGVAVIAGDALVLSPSLVKSELIKKLSLMSLIQPSSRIDVYIIFASERSVDHWGTEMDIVGRLLGDVDLSELNAQAFIGHFVDVERTDFVFEK